MTYTLTDGQLAALIILVVWELIWKTMALWRSARRNQPYWFGAILLINSAGILPIIYVLLTDWRSEPSDETHAKTPMATGA